MKYGIIKEKQDIFKASFLTKKLQFVQKKPTHNKTISAAISMFTSSALKRKIKAFQDAEAEMVSLSKNFGDNTDCSIEVFDTRIPKSCIPIKNDKCMIFSDKDGNNDTYNIHGVCAISTKGETNQQDRPPLILLHGYCNSALYFYRNLNGLCSHFQTVYSLDMFGWGLSSRPQFKTTDDSIETTEAVFVESLEAWREAIGIEKMILGAHSMGGYFSVAYCERYPERVERLILISPVGVPHHEGEHKITSPSWKMQTLFKLMKTLWRNNVTPGYFLRLLPEKKGRDLIFWYAKRKLAIIEEKEALCSFMYLNNALPGSGEYALNRVLKPIAYARNPTIYRIPKLKVSNISFIYGEKDWMDPSSGGKVQETCQEMGNNAPSVDVYIVRNGGHLMFLENWEEFNSAMIVSDDGVLPIGSPKPKKFDPVTWEPSKLGAR